MLTYSIAILLLILAFPPVGCYNFLVISPVYGYSHIKFMATIANQLADEGHRVTYFQPFVIEAYHDHKLIRHDNISAINYYHDEEGRRHIPPSNDLEDAWYSSKYQSGLATLLEMPKFLFGAFEHMCRKIFQDQELHQMLRSQDFDVVFAETFDFCGLYLADYLQARSIISVFTGSRQLSTVTPLGEPSWIHYLPAPSSTSFGPGASFFDRINDLYHKFVFGSGYGVLFDWQYYQVARLTDGKVRYWKEILSDVTYHFTNSNPYLDFPVPSIAKVIPIGGYDISTTMEFSDSDKMNFDNILSLRPITVFISFGSMVKAQFMPESYKTSMLSLFSANLNNITFIWKYENPKELAQKVSENVVLGEWFPQRALLADKRMKLFITHGGLGSTMELAYQGKPAIVIPLIAEQPDNAKMLARHGGVEIFPKTLIPNWQDLNYLLQRMLQTDSYQKSADRLAHLLSRQPVKPRELMVRHAEMAAEFGRMPELTPVAQKMGIVEFWNLDILLVMVLLMLGILLMLLLMLGMVLKSPKPGWKVNKKVD